MASTDLNDMIEGDLMYTDQLNLLHEEIILASDYESINQDDSNHLDCIVLDDTMDDDEIKIISCKMKTVPEDVSNDRIQIIATNITTKQEPSISVDRDPNDSAGTASTPYSLDSLKNISTVNQKTLPKEIKKRFVSKDLVDSICVNCNKINKIFIRSKRGKCKSCKTLFKYQCTQCKNRYKTFQKAFLHVKLQCELAKNYLTSFHCSTCYYNTRNQANLKNHVLNHHAVKKCIDCNEEFENSQMVKHRIFECKAAVSGHTHSKGELKISSENVKKKRGRKPKYAFESVFLIKYCKSCDATKDITADGDYSTCKNCNAKLEHQCVTCCKRFQQLSNAKVHVHGCNYPRRFQCSDCNYHTAYKANLIAHLDCKHKQKECEVCLTACESNSSLRKHEKYDCKRHPRFQGVKLSRKPRKKNITNTFNVLKLYCSRCKEGYERTSSVLSSCTKCNNEVQLQCVKCLALFKHFSTGYKHIKGVCLLKREQKVTRKNTYKHKKCPECHRNNLKPESFDVHLKQCKSLPSFQCSSCSFSTKKKDNLRKHYNNIHLHGQTYFSCSNCQNKFRYSSLRKHQHRCRIINDTSINKTKVQWANSKGARAHFQNGNTEYVDDPTKF